MMFRLDEAPLLPFAATLRRKKSDTSDDSSTTSIGSVSTQKSESSSEEGGSSIISTGNDWRRSRAKRNIIRNLNDKSSKIHKMTTAEIYEHFVKRYGYNKKKSLPNIKRLLKNFEENTGPFAKDRRAPTWKTSEAKALLTKLLLDRDSDVHKMSPEEIHKSDPLFLAYPLDRFKQNVKNLKKSITRRKKIIQEEESAFQADSKAFPREQKTSRGYPFWDSHPASTLMERDIKNGKKENKKPKEFWQSRREYREFPLEVFRWHMYQVLRENREGPYWIKRRNDAMMRKRDADIERTKTEWGLAGLARQWEEIGRNRTE